MARKLIASAALLVIVSASLANSAAQNAGTAGITIETEHLPEATPQQGYWTMLRANGGVPLLHWTVIRGKLPPGLELQDSGVITGVPTTAGEFRFTAEVNDSAQPPNRLHRQFTIIVLTPLLLDWSRIPTAQGDRIDGAVKITNGTKDSFDLTVIVVAVNEIGKAFALGYQRMDFKAGTADLQIPFGSTLPQGAYVVHADAVAEVPSRNAIFRRRLQTPAPLQITVGP